MSSSPHFCWHWLEGGFSLPALSNNPLFPHPHNITFFLYSPRKTSLVKSTLFLLCAFTRTADHIWGKQTEKCWPLSLKCLIGKSQVGYQHCLAIPVCTSSQITVSVSEKANSHINSSSDFHDTSPFLIFSSWSCFLFHWGNKTNQLALFWSPHS